MSRAAPLLDRAGEQSALHRAAESAASGEGSLVVVEGSPGIGKTSILAEHCADARADGWQVLTARGSRLEQEFAFGVVRQLVDTDPAAGPPEPGEEDGVLLGVLTEPGRHPDVPPGAASEFQILHDLYWWLVRRTDRGPVLLALDDAQWSDLSSLRFLSFLAVRLDRLRVALVVATRPPDEHQRADLVTGMMAQSASVLLHPSPLSETAVADLVRRALGDPAPAFVAACLRASGGNPFLLNELIRALARGDVSPTAEAVDRIERVGPVAVRRHVLARLLGRPDADRRLSEALAVLGPRTELSLAASLAGLSAGEADAAVDSLVGLDLVEGDSRLSFRHPMLAAAVYDAIPPRARRGEHARAAELLDAREASAERVSAHVLEADPSGDIRRTEILLAAAMEARRRGAPDSAAVYLRRAVAEPPPQELASEVVRQLGNCEAYTLEWDNADRDLREAVRLSRSDEHRALAAYSLGRYLEVTSRPDAGAGVLRDALDSLREDAVPELRVRIAAELAGYCTVVLDHGSRRRETLEALGREASTWRPLPAVLEAHAALTGAMTGEHADAVATRAERSLDGGLLAADLSALYVAVTALGPTGRLDEATHHLQRAVDWARLSGLRVAESLGHAHLATIALWGGDLASAQSELDAGWDRSAGRDHSVPVLLGCQLEVHVERDELDLVPDRLARSPITAEVTSTCHGLRAVYGRGRWLLAADRPREALADFRLLGRLYRSWDAEEMLELPWRSGAARSLAALGDVAGATDLVDRELGLAERFGAPRPLGIALQAAAEVQPDGALGHARRAVEVLENGSAQLELARAQALLGNLLLDGGDRRGRDLLRDSLEAAVRCGADALQGSVHSRLMRAGGRPPRLQTTGIESLTPAEARVATMVAKEMTNREIARDLYVTEKTVETHLTSTFRKLQVRSRQELSRFVHDADDQTRFRI